MYFYVEYVGGMVRPWLLSYSRELLPSDVVANILCLQYIFFLVNVAGEEVNKCMEASLDGEISGNSNLTNVFIAARSCSLNAGLKIN